MNRGKRRFLQHAGIGGLEFLDCGWQAFRTAAIDDRVKSTGRQIGAGGRQVMMVAGKQANEKACKL